MQHRSWLSDSIAALTGVCAVNARERPTGVRLLRPPGGRPRSFARQPSTGCADEADWINIKSTEGLSDASGRLDHIAACRCARWMGGRRGTGIPDLSRLPIGLLRGSRWCQSQRGSRPAVVLLGHVACDELRPDLQLPHAVRLSLASRIPAVAGDVSHRAMTKSALLPPRVLDKNGRIERIAFVLSVRGCVKQLREAADRVSLSIVSAGRYI